MSIDPVNAIYLVAFLLCMTVFLCQFTTGKNLFMPIKKLFSPKDSENDPERNKKTKPEPEPHNSRLWFFIKQELERIEKRIMANLAELTADLNAVLAQQQKTALEIASVQAGVDTLNAKVAELEAVIAAGLEPTQELIDAVAAVKAQAQVVDELIPDLPVVEPPPVP